jgi:hypothetical protein
MDCLAEHMFEPMRNVCLTAWCGMIVEEVKAAIKESGVEAALQGAGNRDKQALMEKVQAAVKKKMEQDITSGELKMEEVGSAANQENKKLKVCLLALGNHAQKLKSTTLD